MIRICHHRKKCIGCNYCVEFSDNVWRMSKKDGKSILLNAKNKNNIYTSIVGEDEYQSVIRAANSCPTKIIKFQKVN